MKRTEEDVLSEELKKFQGTWKQIAYEKDGVKDAVDELGEPRATFVGNTYVVTLADGSVIIKGTFKLDPNPGGALPSRDIGSRRRAHDGLGVSSRVERIPEAET